MFPVVNAPSMELSKRPCYRLQDFRHLTSSEEMALALLEGMKKAFNNGDIIPTGMRLPSLEKTAH